VTLADVGEPKGSQQKIRAAIPFLMEWDIFLAATPVFANNEHMKTLSPQASPLASTNPRTVVTSEQASILIRAIVAATPNAALTVDADGRPKGYKLPGDQEVYLGYDSYKNRIHVSGCWPYSRIEGEKHQRFGPWGLHPRPGDTAISISADKAPEKIAAEIGRRFMPAYEVVLARCLERREQHETYIRNQNSLTMQVATALNKDAKSNGTHFYLSDNISSGYGSVEVRGDTVKVEVSSLPANKALKLIEFLKTL
jgi:hypothetical protein